MYVISYIIQYVWGEKNYIMDKINSIMLKLNSNDETNIDIKINVSNEESNMNKTKKKHKNIKRKERRKDMDKTDYNMLDNTNDESHIDIKISENEKTQENIAIENWKNKANVQLEGILTQMGKENKINSSAEYKDGYVDKQRVLNTLKPKSTNEAVIINGNLLTAIKICSKQSISVSNTCAFDSLLVAFTIGYADFNLFKKYVNKHSTKNDFLNLCKDVALFGSNASTYKKRALLLLNSGIFIQSKIQSGTETLNCSANVIGLSYRLLFNIPSSIKTETCENCQNINTYKNTTIILENIQTNNFIKLNKMIKNYIEVEQKHCTKCQTNKGMVNTELQKHLMIETDYMIDHKTSCRIIDIPNELFVMNTR